MITERLFGEDFVSLVAWSLSCWVMGVGWSAYRALGWVDRMRLWAQTVEDEGCSVSGAPLVGAADIVRSEQ